MKISIAVVSYKRPAGLARLLHAIGALVLPESAPGCDPALVPEVLVVDNDPAQSAGLVCDALRPTLPWALHSVHEPRRGIACARNAAVRVALTHGADAVAFIDDDEVPEPRWLAELVNGQQQYEADIVFGPVIRSFDGPVPGWVARGRFFDRPRHSTGARVAAAGAGNVLVCARVFREMPRLFDERIGLGSGEDHEFFARAAGAGYSMVWSDEAIVHELIPSDRATARWLLRRSYSHGNTTWFLQRDDQPVLTRGAGVFVALGGLARGVLLASGAVLLGRDAVVRHLQAASYHLGSLAAAAGRRYQEYRTVPDRPAIDRVDRVPADVDRSRQSAS